jgi:hypothetical protein
VAISHGDANQLRTSCSKTGRSSFAMNVTKRHSEEKGKADASPSTSVGALEGWNPIASKQRHGENV